MANSKTGKITSKGQSESPFVKYTVRRLRARGFILMPGSFLLIRSIIHKGEKQLKSDKSERRKTKIHLSVRRYYFKIDILIGSLVESMKEEFPGVVAISRRHLAYCLRKICPFWPFC